jgi:hypothetical protein
MVDLSKEIDLAGEHIGKVIRMMVDGVAFPDNHDSRRYVVYSHEGDDLGHISTNDVGYAISFMKQRGRQVGKMRTTSTNFAPAFSFAWIGWHWLDC